MLSGHTPEQVPHWMQPSNCSHPGTLMTSRPKPFTRSASYLIVRCIAIISASAEVVSPRPSPRRQPTTFRRLQRLSAECDDIPSCQRALNANPNRKSQHALPNALHFLCKKCHNGLV